MGSSIGRFMCRLDYSVAVFVVGLLEQLSILSLSVPFGSVPPPFLVVIIGGLCGKKFFLCQSYNNMFFLNQI